MSLFSEREDGLDHRHSSPDGFAEGAGWRREQGEGPRRRDGAAGGRRRGGSGTGMYKLQCITDILTHEILFKSNFMSNIHLVLR